MAGSAPRRCRKRSSVDAREWQLGGADQADPAQRAPAAAATDAGVWNVGPPAGLKHTEADRHGLPRAVRVGDGKALPASLETRAHQPGNQNQQDGAAIEYQEIIPQVAQPRNLCRRAGALRHERHRAPIGVLCQRDDLTTRLEETQQCQDREQDGGAQ